MVKNLEKLYKKAEKELSQVRKNIKLLEEDVKFLEQNHEFYIKATIYVLFYSAIETAIKNINTFSEAYKPIKQLQ